MFRYNVSEKCASKLLSKVNLCITILNNKNKSDSAFLFNLQKVGAGFVAIGMYFRGEENNELSKYLISAGGFLLFIGFIPHERNVTFEKLTQYTQNLITVVSNEFKDTRHTPYECITDIIIRFEDYQKDLNRELEKYRAARIAFLSASHPRLGNTSAAQSNFFQSIIHEPKLIEEIFDAAEMKASRFHLT